MTGGDLAEISARLRGKPGVDQIAAFGSSLHVTGEDDALLEKTLREAIAGSTYRVQRAQTGLEDVFIHLMHQSVDNFEATR